MDKLNSIQLSNLELYKDQVKSYRESIRKIFFTCLKELPREMIIETLKQKKIIKTDLNLETNKLELMEVKMTEEENKQETVESTEESDKE